MHQSNAILQVSQGEKDKLTLVPPPSLRGSGHVLAVKNKPANAEDVRDMSYV